MEFAKPTTKSKMYEVLKEIFYYYRIKREAFEGVTLVPLNLERMQFSPLSEAQMKSKAEEALACELKADLKRAEDEISSEEAEINSRLSLIPTELAEKIEKVNALYEESEDKLEKKAVKNGILYSDIPLEQLAFLEDKKNERIAELQSESLKEKNLLSSRLSSLEEKRKAAEKYYSESHDLKIKAKITEIRDEQEEKEREVFKYNNGLDEKEQRYSNTILRSNADVQLKFMEIRSEGFTKDELIEMGYYTDAVECVCAYYDTLSASAAFSDISKESKLAIYLDEYYGNILYMYKMRV